MAALADIADASRRFKGGIVVYSSADKSDVLGVGEDVIASYCVVSAECAEAMAKQVREKFGSDIGVAITGVSGPSSQEGKPVGLTYVAVASETQTAVREHRYAEGRAANRVPPSRRCSRWRPSRSAAAHLAIKPVCSLIVDPRDDCFTAAARHHRTHAAARW